MTLTVGTNSYISIANADIYWSARNDSVWSAASDAEKEKALIEATQYIDGNYEFIGEYITSNTLAWPRNFVYVTHGNFAGKTIDSNTIPQAVKDACCELALEALSARLMAIKDRGGAVKREKVDVVEVEYSDFAPSGKTYNFATSLLKPLLVSAPNMKRLVR